MRWEGGGAHQAVLHLEGGEIGRGRGSPGSTSVAGKGPPLLLPSYLEAIYICPVWGGNEDGGRVKSGVCIHTHINTHTHIDTHRHTQTALLNMSKVK